MDLACAQVQEYAHSQWSATSGEDNKPIRDTLFQFFNTMNIIECLANFPWWYYVGIWKLKWFADMFIIECPMNVNTRLMLLDALLYDLNELGRLAFDEKFIPDFYQRWYYYGNVQFEECESSFGQVSKSLIELDISNCTSLENFNEVSSSIGDTLLSLEVLHCLKVKLDKFFSLKGCSNLNTLTLGGNANLEVLYLSATQLNKFCMKESSPQLRSINIVGTKCLRAVDWAHIPQEVNWDEFGVENLSVCSRQEFGAPPKDKNRGGVYIAISSDIIFKTLGRKYFSQFHICLFNSKERGKEKRMFVPRGRTHYNDIYMRTKSPSFPYYISNALSHTQFLSLYDDRSIKRLSDFRVENLAEIKECWIEKCYSMETIFDLQPSGLAKPEPSNRDEPSDSDEPEPSDLPKPKPILGCLEKLRISKVMKATHMCIIPGPLKRRSFGCLKHMHLEYCPRLSNVFTSGLCLENLEVVEIKFCARLQEVFSGKGYNVEGSFSKLHTLCLIELPALTTIIEDVVSMPALTKIKVKGCPKLRMLPLGNTTSNHASSSKHPVPLNVTSVVVSGNPDWWDRLQWADKNVKEHLSFECWPLLKFPRQA